MKERLIGAAVLVALGVWLIPWVLDGSDETRDSGANALQLPATEEPLPVRSQTLSLDTDSSAPETVAANEAPAARDPVPSAAAIESKPLELPRPVVSEPAPPAAAAAEAPTVARSAPPVVAPRATPPAPAATKPPAPTAAAKPTTAAGQGAWIVQLGSFGEEQNARKLADRVRTLGYKPEVSNIRSNGKTLYRVRVGSAQARGPAEATASALSAHGITAKVVAAD